MSRQKIGVFIIKADYIPSWFQPGVLDKLAEKFSVTVFVPNQLLSLVETYRLRIPDVNIGIARIESPKSTYVSDVYSFLLMLSLRKRSKSIKFRLRRMLLGELLLFPYPLSMKKTIHSFVFNLKSFIRYFLNPNHIIFLRVFIPLPILLKIFQELFNKSTCDISNLIHFKLDWAIFPSGANDIYTYRLMREFNSLNIKTFLCLENWDNLTSKSFIITKPNFIAVMGNECKVLASSVQNIDSETVIVLGLPRFNPYRFHQNFMAKDLDTFLGRPVKVIYLGCSMPHNEINLLNSLLRCIDIENLKWQFELIYKPHPARRPRFYEDTNLDSRVKLAESGNKFAVPIIDKGHMNQILDADIVISAPTTMMIEAMILNKKVIVDVSDDNIHRTTAGKAIKRYDHFNSILTNKDLLFCKTSREMLLGIMDYLENTHYVEYDLENLIENSSTDYGSKLVEVISNKSLS